MNLVIVAVVQLLCLLLLSEETHTRSMTVVKRMILKSNGERIGLQTENTFNLCRMRCAKASREEHSCSQKCVNLLKSGESSFIDGHPRKRRSYDDNTLQSQTKETLSLHNSTISLPGIEIKGTHVWILPENVNSSKFNLTTFDPSVPPPKLPPEVLESVEVVDNDFSEGCQNVIYQTISNSSPSGENNDLPLFVNVTFSGGNHEPWKAIASWKYNLTGKMTRNITGFMVYWYSDSESFSTELSCRKLPHNETTVTINAGDGWTYPDVLYLAVQSIPIVEWRDPDLTAFSPKRNTSLTTPSTT